MRSGAALTDRTRSGLPAAEQWLPVLYTELRRLASSYLAHERPDHTLQPTALVHEAYIRLAGGQPVEGRSRAQFFALVAKVMRQVLVDHGKAHRAAKRGGGKVQLSYDDLLALYHEPALDLIALDEALSDLAVLDSQQARIVELRFFGGLTVLEIAEVLEVSVSTIEREWRLARAWLYTRIQPQEDT